ncbi:hypothetical protein F5X68DRAFT_237155 [Plectosphaerella plurivora]|uniref:Protein kinase domain-containing protein n=1 Tax=Plectosphaerella plurivora TaxID=936078 RepID=A0A9P8V256_9PEZI|nr:hypothetical protein F5X68DRAFT_237155 [Plectosphaerella plurivora]
MSGLEIFGAVGVSLQLAKAAASCLSTVLEIKLISKLTLEQNDSHFGLIVQAFKFEKWCAALGIHQQSDTTTDRHGQFRSTIETRLRLENVTLVQWTMIALDDMDEKFASAAAILAQYASSPTPSPSYIDALLSSIKETNELLLVLLDPAAQAQVSRQTDMAILDRVDHDTLSSNASSRPDLNDLARIRLWQKREQKEISQENYENSTPSLQMTMSAVDGGVRVNSYHMHDFTKGTLPSGEYRALTTLGEKPVLVEWKHYSHDRPLSFEQTIRIGSLVGLLNRNKLHDRFMTLPCQGLVEDAGNSRIGIIFSADTPAGAKLKSLQRLIQEEDVPPSVGQRFELAKHLAAAVHHLHSVDWLHKSIRSDNLVCFWEQKAGLPLPAQPTSQPSIAQGVREHELPGPATAPQVIRPYPSLPPFHLVGWDLSRPDHPMELSETLSISTAGYQNRRDAIEMYSHPEIHAQTERERRARYRAEFDIYSLGLVLLEIGLWRTLAMLRKKCHSDAGFRSKLVTKSCDKLPPKMGEIYCGVVRRCLTNDFGQQDRSEPQQADEDGFSMQLAFEQLVVLELEQCSA